MKLTSFPGRLVSRPTGQAQRGLTLVELMVALTLSLLLSLAMVQLFIGNKQTFRMLEGSSRLQENGRFAVGFISRELQVAGYHGCIIDADKIHNVLNGESSSFLWGFSRAVQGFNANTSSWTPNWTATSYLDFDFPGALPGADIITLNVVEGLDLKATQAGVITSATYGEAPITVTVDSGLEADDIIYVTDCEKGAITQLTAVNSGGKSLEHAQKAATSKYPGNSKKSLDHVYDDAEVFRLRAVSFYLRNGASGRPSLWRKINKEDPEELVEGVEDMQILYGVADDVDQWGTVTKYLSADQVDTANDWDKVASVRINLLLQSADGLAEQKQTYTFAGAAPVTASDERIRREFVSTVGVRNRIL